MKFVKRKNVKNFKNAKEYYTFFKNDYETLGRLFKNHLLDHINKIPTLKSPKIMEKINKRLIIEEIKFFGRLIRKYPCNYQIKADLLRLIFKKDVERKISRIQNPKSRIVQEILKESNEYFELIEKLTKNGTIPFLKSA